MDRLSDGSHDLPKLLRSGGRRLVGFDNYKEIFTGDILLTAVKNNMIWVLVVPAFVTAIGLIFAVLLERVSWSFAFKTVVFMPMAISAFAAGITWRIVYTEDPDLGALVAGIAAVHDTFQAGQVLPKAVPSTDGITGSADSGFALDEPLQPGGVAQLGLTRISTDRVPRRRPGGRPEPLQGGITGVVWQDFKPGGGEPGQLEQDEVGLPGVTVELRDEGGGTVASTKAQPDGTFAFEEVDPGSYQVAVGSETFAEPFGGVAWLGRTAIRRRSSSPTSGSGPASQWW